MPTKRYVVIVTFPSAPAGLAQQEFTLPASDPGVAVKRAIQQATWNIKRKTRHRKLSEVGKVSWQLVPTVRVEDTETHTDASGYDQAGPIPRT